MGVTRGRKIYEALRRGHGEMLAAGGDPVDVVFIGDGDWVEAYVAIPEAERFIDDYMDHQGFKNFCVMGRPVCRYSDLKKMLENPLVSQKAVL